MKVGLYGGTFDPIHNAHLIIADFIKERLGLNKVIFIPSGIPPHKKAFSSKTLRLIMVQLAIEGNPEFECSTVELERDGPSYSVDTIAQIKEQLRVEKNDLFWIIGSDSIVDFCKWKEPARILEMCNLVVFPRQQNDVLSAPEEFKDHTSIQFINAPIIEISSTQIRNLIKEGRSVRYLVPPAVEAVIDSRGLYR